MTAFANTRCLITLAVVSACGGNGLTIDPIEDQVAAVGEELSIEIHTQSKQGGQVAISVRSESSGLKNGSSVLQRPDGSSVFTWTPGINDLGIWTVDFKAYDGSDSATESLLVEVRSTMGADSLPTFNRPLGAGTSLDLDSEDCVEIDLGVQDQDSTEVSFVQLEPVIQGAELMQDGDQQARWRWCPTPEQAATKERYVLTVGADDGENPLSVKHYQIVLRSGGDGADCGGKAPRIQHTPPTGVAADGVIIEAQIIDSDGLKAPPLLHYSTEDPGSPPDLESMLQVPMKLTSGDNRDGTWSAEIPPIPPAQAASRTLYYAIVADDNDDRGGGCDHVVTSEHQVSLGSDTEPPPTPGGRDACEPCDSSAQCGGADDLCLPMGSTRKGFCTLACDDDTVCPAGTVCPEAPFTSTDGETARQCVPSSGTCEVDSCKDDTFEPNGSMNEAALARTFQDGVADDLVLCPLADLSGDEDWFEVTITEPGFLNFYIAGDLEDDEVDIALFDENGRALARSENWGPSDSVGRCLPPGRYYASVYSYFPNAHTYTIGYDHAPMSCEPTTCEDDLFEDDDDPVYGRVADLATGYHSTDNRICPGDEDWFFVFLDEGESVFAELRFEQHSFAGDLDLLVYDGNNMELLTPCSPDNVDACDVHNGQSSDANESLAFAPETPGYYYVIVAGFSGGSNDYDLCLSKSRQDCL